MQYSLFDRKYPAEVIKDPAGDIKHRPPSPVICMARVS